MIAAEITATSVLTKKQKKSFGPKPISGYGKGALITAQVQFDDECGNGHNSFSITGTVYIPGRRDIEAGGCLHDEISKAFPELVPFIKWHLSSTDGPMHYVANTVYHASNRDHHGLLAGEKRQLRNGKSGQLAWQLVAVDDNGNEIERDNLPKIYVDSDTQPTGGYRMEYKPWFRVGEGKTRELDAARRAAVWPEATDEELMSPDLATKLETRLPQLLADFKKDVETLGFVW